MILKCWDDKCVVFHSESGNTHLLSLAYARILEKLQHRETSESITNALLDENLVADADTAMEMIASACKQFRQLHLVR
jgi:PqqD family protein of HPr-rel-A system